ncbi:uncharacterized protein BXIN_1991 [Babesia sp. Xinjiang]|uniref:uncharacterized protein n=1 Tax=Babesia sp. Xinjiang TaxID=462227 RepID=UPI000A23415D|nr:uncharacterized protein BXIN_1991 [Babesia sp. Xinjiang]ORM40397.1 hypothetical protein BXIN_1991 [Babesia sp. Xinjiang]
MAIQPQKEAADAIRITPLIMQQLVVVGGFVLLLVVCRPKVKDNRDPMGPGSAHTSTVEDQTSATNKCQQNRYAGSSFVEVTNSDHGRRYRDEGASRGMPTRYDGQQSQIC